MDTTAFGDRMKLYEGMEAKRRATPFLPVIARLDGKCFSKFTKGLCRPYDERFVRLMVDTTIYLVEETHARIGYTQSDEISLLYYSDVFDSQIFMNGRIQKMTSVLAAMATARFNRQLDEVLPEKAGRMPLFDCRVWTVPNKQEAANTFLWREQDATRNSISMAAQSIYSHRQLFGKNTSEMQELLFQKGINWNDYPEYFKRGSFVQRTKVAKPFSTDEIDRLPAKHAARVNPDLVVERHETRAVRMPAFGTVTNRVDVLFDGAVPETTQESQ